MSFQNKNYSSIGQIVEKRSRHHSFFGPYFGKRTLIGSSKKKGREMSKKKKKALKPSIAIKKEAPQKLSFLYWLLPPTLLSMITTAFYYPSLHYPFQFDDLANISKKFSIRFSDPLSTWWHNRRWMGEWLNRLNFEWGRFDPFYYRLTNLVVHIIAGVLVFYLILEGCRHLKKGRFLEKYAVAIATTTSALFLLHPTQTQAVSYVIQARLEGLATLFVVAALLAFLKAFQTRNPFLRYTLFSLSTLIGFASCGTKEIAIVSPLLAILLDWFFIAQEDWKSLKSRLIFHGIFSVVIFGTFIHYLSPKFIADIVKLKVTAGNNRGNILTAHAKDVIRPLAFLISEFKVVLHYLLIFLWPLSISVEYDWKLSENFFAPDSFFPFLLLVALFSLAIYVFTKKKHSFIGFGLLWFFIAVGPRSSIIPSPELVVDYKTYLPSIGWLFIIATALVALIRTVITGITFLPSSLLRPLPQLALIMVLMFPVGYGAMQRNIVWSTSVDFWRNITINAPGKARGHNNLGVALSEDRKFNEAIPCYLEAIRLDRDYSDPWSNLAVAYSQRNEIDKAIGALRQAIRIWPHYPEAYNNLGTLMIQKKNYNAAEKILLTALKLRPYYGKAFYNLGRLFTDKGELDTAWKYFKKATEGDLDTLEGFLTLGQMSIKLKKFDEAARAFEIAYQRSGRAKESKREAIKFHMANSYFMLKQYDKANAIFTLLCKAQPNNHRYLYNLAETCYTTKKFERALKLFRTLSQAPFGFVQANFRYASCLEKLKQYDKAKQLLRSLATNKKAPANIKKIAQNELGRITLQQKINKGNCTLTRKDLQAAFKITSS